MATIIPQQLTPTQIIQIGKLAQVYAANGNSTSNALKGGNVDNRLPYLLYAVRKPIQWLNGNNPTYPTLQDTANYYYALFAYWGRLALNRTIQINQGVLSITNPVGFFATVGQTATFSVSVTSSTPYTILWYLNGSPAPGINNQLTYSFPNAQLTDSGDSFFAIATNAAGSAQSTNAILTVTQPIQANAYYGNIDFFIPLSGGTDNVPYQITTTITHNAPITINWPLAAANNMFEVIRYPATENIKTAWFNTNLNAGTIPDSVFRAVLTINGFNYLISRVQMSLDSTNTTETFT